MPARNSVESTIKEHTRKKKEEKKWKQKENKPEIKTIKKKEKETDEVPPAT